MPYKKSIAARFSRASGTYSESAAVQREMVTQLVEKLPDSHPKRILEIGCGTGILSEELLKKYPQAEIDAVDIAPGMIDFCCRKYALESRVHWHVADILDFKFAGKYDLIVSSSAIHWVTDLDHLFERLHEVLSDAGLVIFSLMLENTFCELHEAKEAILDAGRLGGRLPSFEQVSGSVEQAGFMVVTNELYRRSVQYPSAKAFFRELNAQGVTSGRVSRSETPLSRRELHKLAQTYEHMFAHEEGGIMATYECGLFSCRRF